jgi:hypothetical protein
LLIIVFGFLTMGVLLIIREDASEPDPRRSLRARKNKHGIFIS